MGFLWLRVMLINEFFFIFGSLQLLVLKRQNLALQKSKKWMKKESEHGPEPVLAAGF